MPLPLGAVLLEHVQMMGASRGTLNKVVPARDAMFPAVLVAESYQQRRELVAIIKSLNSNGDVKDRFCENSWYGRAPDVLNVDCGRSKYGGESVPLGRKAQRPFRADGDQAQLSGIQTKVWSVGVVLHERCGIVWDGPNWR